MNIIYYEKIKKNILLITKTKIFCLSQIQVSIQTCELEN